MRRTMAHSNSLPTKRPSWSSFTSSAVWKKNPRDIGHHLINMIPCLWVGVQYILFPLQKALNSTKLSALYQACQTKTSKNLSNRTLWHCVLIHTPLIPPPNKIQKTGQRLFMVIAFGPPPMDCQVTVWHTASPRRNVTSWPSEMSLVSRWTFGSKRACRAGCLRMLIFLSESTPLVIDVGKGRFFASTLLAALEYQGIRKKREDWF